MLRTIPAVLLSCVFSSGSIAMPPPPVDLNPEARDTKYLEFNVIDGIESTIPSYSEEMGTQTVEGVDSDGDYVRDDIEIIIYQMKVVKSGVDKNRAYRNSLYNIAYFYSRFMGGHHSQGLAYHYYAAPKYCLENDRTMPDAAKTIIEIEAEFMNTWERIGAYYGYADVMAQYLMDGERELSRADPDKFIVAGLLPSNICRGATEAYYRSYE